MIDNEQDILAVLAHFQERIKDISMRFQDLRDITYELYKENGQLKEENEELKQLLFDKQNDGKAYSNLNHLYNEGFHICHLSFGDKREHDCLFCIQLLEEKFEQKN